MPKSCRRGLGGLNLQPCQLRKRFEGKKKIGSEQAVAHSLSPPSSILELLEELENVLLDGIGLGERRDAGLAEHLVLGHVAGGLAEVGCADVVLRRGQVDR